MYNQCHLRNNGKQQTAWIPSKFANEGSVVKIHGEDGWIVEFVGVGCENPPTMAWKKHRGHTDVPHGTFKDLTIETGE